MKSIIIGKGEIGNSLKNVLSKEYIIDTYDIMDIKVPIGKYKYMHVCFPQSKDFVNYVQEYKKKFSPKYTVIHSTVKPGTSKLCDAVHSPCMGIHPNLESGLKTFIKFLGGEKASEVANYFRRAGLKVYITEKAETTEIMKILSTTYYATCIEYTKQVKKTCIEYDIPFEMWTLWNNNYNKGYQKLGHEEYIRPNLTPIMTPQGGHCTIPNLELLDFKFMDFIKELNNEKN